MKTEELTITFSEKTLAVPGWRMTPTGAALEGRASAEGFRNAFRFLHATTGWNAWWWGDVILAYCEFEKADKGKEDGAWVRYANEWEEIVGLSAGTLHHYCQVAKAFKSVCRHIDLSWAHHYEVYAAGITDEHEMQDWLGRALQEKWSKTALRAALRAAKREAAGRSDDDSKPVALQQEWIFAAKTGSRILSQRVPEMEEEELDRLLADLEPMLALAKAASERRLALRAQAGGGKESLRPAA